MTKRSVVTVAGKRGFATVGDPIIDKVGAGGAWRSTQVEEIAVVLTPEIPFVALHTYVAKPRQTNDEVMIHAMCAELWMGVSQLQ